MSERPAISIITPCFNTGKLIEDLADSLAAQTLQDFEWCISDDGSEEETRTILRNLESKYAFPIKVQCFEKQGGNYCRNQGFQASTGRFVKFVDADDVLENDLLEKQFSIAEQHPEGVVVSPTKVLQIDGEHFVIPLDPELKSDALRSYLRKATFMHGGCLLPRSLVQDAGCWDESLQAGQDLDFYRRVLLTNTDVHFAGSHFVYRHHDQAVRISNLSGKDLRKFEGHLEALDNFHALLEQQGKLADYSFELAQNYDVWGMKALALGIPFADKFLKKAKSLSKDYRSGSGYSKVLRRIMGDRLTSKLIRSSGWKWLHQRLVKFGIWPSH